MNNALLRGCLLATAVAVALPTTASAGRIEAADAAFDTIEESNYFNNGKDGQFWQAPESPGSIVNPAPGTLFNMALDFGAGPVTGIKFLFYQTGRVEFLDSRGVATGDYIDPFGLSGGYSTRYANASFTNGKLDPIYLTATTFPTGTFDPVNGLQAFRFQWPSNCPNSEIIPGPNVCQSNKFLNFQALLIEIDPENFQLQFNYQNTPDSLPPDVAMGSFKIGANVGVPYLGPFLDTGPNYCFHNGTLVSCTGTSAVPEPSTVPLLAFGALILGVASVQVRRRRGIVALR